MKKMIIALEICAATLVLAGGTVFAAVVGTQEDPLVSKSYVDSKISQVLTLINDNGTGSKADTDAIAEEVMKKISEGEVSGGAVAVDTYVPVSVAVGKTIYGAEGTELILRAGKGTVTVSGVDGIADLTTGNELKTGDKATKNHIMIVPRDDGRGIKVTEAAWFLVKGGYQIK